MAEVRIVGSIPEGAESAVLRLGFDRRNIPVGKRVIVRDLRLYVLADTPRYERRGSFSSEVRETGKVSW